MKSLIEELDDDTLPLESSVMLNHHDAELDIDYFIDFTKSRTNFLLSEDIEEATIAKNLSPKAIANAIYKRKYSSIGTLYTEMYSDFPLLVSAELIKRRKIIGGRMLRPKYLADIVYLYESTVGNRWRERILCPYYGVLAISMCAAYGYVDTAIALANKYPKLLNKSKQPSSLVLFLQLVSKCSMEGIEQSIPTTEVYKNIQNQWVNILVDNYPAMLDVWNNTPNFERI